MDAHLWPCRWAALVAHPHSPTSRPRTCGRDQASPGLSTAATWPLRSSWCICAFCSIISSSRSRGRELSRPAPEPPLLLPRPQGLFPNSSFGGRAGEGGGAARTPRECAGQSGVQSGEIPESHLPSRGPAVGTEVGWPTGGAAEWSPRAGGRGRLSQTRWGRDGDPLLAPHAFESLP